MQTPHNTNPEQLHETAPVRAEAMQRELSATELVAVAGGVKTKHDTAKSAINN